MSTPATTSVSPELAALRRVQRRGGAIAFFAVAIHGVLGLVVAAHVVHGQDRTGDAVVLLVMSGVFAAVTYTVVRVILAARWWSPAWMLLATVPTVVGFIWVL